MLYVFNDKIYIVISLDFMKITYLRKISNSLKTKRCQKILLFIAPIVIILCLSLGLLGYINFIPGSASKFYIGSSLGVVVRGLSFAGLFSYSICCSISFKIRPNYRLITVYCFLLLFNFLMIFLSPHDYGTLYLSQYYKAGAYFYTSVGLKTIMIYYLSSLVDFIWGFCFLWILPTVFKNKRQFVYVFLFFIFIMLITCFYSFFKERNIFILVFTDPSKIGSATGLKSMFDTKQTFGVFLCPAFCSCLFLFHFFSRVSFRIKLFKILLYSSLIISTVIFFFVSIVSLCRTAIIGNLIMLIFFYIALTVGSFKKRKMICGFTLTFILVFIVLLFTLFMSIEPMHNSGVLKNLYDFISKHIFQRVTTSSDSRLLIMIAYFKEIPTLNLFFGFGKGLLDIYVRSLAPILRYGLHSGFAIYFGNFGLISFFITYLLIIKIMWKNLLNIRKNPFLVITLLGSFVTVMFLNISESEILVFSSSSLVFMFNFIIIIFGNSSYIRSIYKENLQEVVIQ